jgi:hypothetical protein
MVFLFRGAGALAKIEGFRVLEPRLTSFEAPDARDIKRAIVTNDRNNEVRCIRMKN